MKDKLILRTLLFILIIAAVVIANVSPNEADDPITSTGAIDAFFDALIHGDAVRLNELFVKHYFDTTDIKNGYPDFPNQNITDIQVTLLDKSTDKDQFYEVVFTITDNTAPPFIIAGSGEKTYFFNLIKEDKNWKIKDIATSP